MVNKKEQTQILNFLHVFSWISNMFIHWVTSNLRLPLEPTLKNRTRKLSPPHIFRARVQLSLSHHVLQSTLKNNSSLLFCLVSAGRTSASPSSAHAYNNFLEPPVFPRHFYNHKSLGLAVRRLSVFLLIFFFQFQLSITCSITLQTIVELFHV